MNLSDDQWSLLKPLFPQPAPQASSRGRPAYPTRAILDAIYWMRRTASPWSNLPPGYPSYLTCRRRLNTIYHPMQPA
jgi:transposase